MIDPPTLSREQVAHVARLARLRPSEVDIERYRAELASVLAHVARLSEIDVSDVEPLTHAARLGVPEDSVNRFQADEPLPALPLEALARNAPAMEGRSLAVPKVLDEDEGS